MSTQTPETHELMQLPAGEAASLSPSDLAELFGAFNEVTQRLHKAHEALQQEVKRLRRELREANDQLERSRRLAALGEMAAGIAHEVRNPLGSIRLYARMLDEDLSDRPEQQATVGKINRAVTGLEAVVVDVLTFSKEITVRPTRIDLADMIERAIETGIRRSDGGRAAINVTCDLLEEENREEGGGIELECDEHLISQVLVNLLRNAAQAIERDPVSDAILSDAAGTITISVDLAPLRNSNGSTCDGVRLSIRDTGPGISPAVIERAFNPFVTTRSTGTGLGLAIVHRIIDAHNGRVHIENVRADQGSGAIVTLLLPLKQRGEACKREATTKNANNQPSPADMMEACS